MTAAVAGTYYDGLSSRRHTVCVAFKSDLTALVLTGDSLAGKVEYPLDRLRGLPDQADKTALALTLLDADSEDESTRDISRLVLRDARVITQLNELCPKLLQRDIKKGTWPRIIKRTVAAVGAVAVILFVILPRMADTLADLIPREREVAFGKAISAQIEWVLGAKTPGALDCKNVTGQASLEAMIGRLTAEQSLSYDLHIKVINHPMVNAFAMPGGQIVVMRGLIDASKGPDAVAAVLAHEIGHVERRDPTRHALRSAGSAGILSMVLGDFSGGTLAVIISEQLLETSYAREAEEKADEFAIGMLNASHVNSVGMSDFFMALAALENKMPELPEYFSTHPVSQERADRARQNAQHQVGTTPALDQVQWAALQKICD